MDMDCHGDSPIYAKNVLTNLFDIVLAELSWKSITFFPCNLSEKYSITIEIFWLLAWCIN